jgi:FkbH-like protein
MDDLGLAPDAVAFVDDDLMERAEVSAGLPGVLVLSPEDAAEAPAWPEFRPAVLTAEGRRRGEMYAERRRRQDAARAWGGSRDEFLRSAGTLVEIAPAAPADLPRLRELSVRTHQFNTAGAPASQDDLAAWLGSPGRDPGRPGSQHRGNQHRLVTARLRDDFGDDGLVGGAVMTAGEGLWTVTLLMMSCRALGRGVLDALLAALLAQAAAAGAGELRIPCLVTERNVPLRLALTAAGFRAEEPGEPGAAVFARGLDGPLPALPDWARVTGAAEAAGP